MCAVTCHLQELNQQPCPPGERPGSGVGQGGWSVGLAQGQGHTQVRAGDLISPPSLPAELFSRNRPRVRETRRVPRG